MSDKFVAKCNGLAEHRLAQRQMRQAPVSMPLDERPGLMVKHRTFAGGGMSDTWLYDEHPAMFRAHPVLFVLLLISIIGILAIAIWWVLHKGERLALSDREVLMEKGLLSKQRTEIALSSIRSVRITQTLGQRIFDVGHVELFSAGDYAEIAIKNMPNPDRIRAIAASRNVDLLPQR